MEMEVGGVGVTVGFAATLFCRPPQREKAL